MIYPHIGTKIILGLQSQNLTYIRVTKCDRDGQQSETDLEITKYDRAGLQFAIDFSLQRATKWITNGLKMDYKVD